jgi:DNA invertase Pin-like site-specific DNA recombinase
MRAAIYCRLSKNRRGKKANVKDQERDCRDYIDSQGWQFLDSYIDDGISASDKSKKPREEFARMMADLRAGLIDVIVASEFTRLYRRPRELEELLDPVDKFHYDIELVTVDPRVRRWDIRTGIGRAELRAAVNQAAEYSDYISEKVRNHAKHRATDGRWHGGKPGYGFDYVPVVRDGEGEELEPEQMTVNEDQAKVVRDVVWRVLAGQRIGTICEELNRHGIRTREGRRWRQGNLHPILVKPAIAGLVKHPEKPDLVRSVWGTFVECSQHLGSKDCFGAIVSEHDWRKLQALLSKPERARDLIGSRTALLTGYVYCGNPECGKKLIATRDQRGKRIYACKRDSHRQGCGKIKRLADPIDQLVTEAIITTLEDADDFTVPLASDDEDFTALYAEKKRLEDRQSQLAIDHYRLTKPDGSPLIDRVPYLAANEALAADIAAIQRKLDRATTHRHVKELPVGEVAQEEWDAHANDLAWRRELVGLLIERIIVKPSQTRHVPFNPDFGHRFDPNSVEIVPRKLQTAPDGHVVSS